MAEKEAARKLEEERLKKEAEEKRQVEEKKRLQQKLLEAEKNKDVVLSGFISVQPSGSPVSDWGYSSSAFIHHHPSFGDADILRLKEKQWPFIEMN